MLHDTEPRSLATEPSADPTVDAIVSAALAAVERVDVYPQPAPQTEPSADLKGEK